MTPSDTHPVSRRTFLATGGAAAATTLLADRIAAAAFMQNKQELKVALIGCGGRGNGALADAYEAAETTGLDLKLVATADWFKDRAETTGTERGLEPEQCHGGAEGYKQVCASDADLVLMATAPLFRPLHFRAAVEAGKHVFLEKPVACDPVGCRHVLETGRMAGEKGLSVVAGTQRRHHRDYVGQLSALQSSDLGAIRGGTVNWCRANSGTKPATTANPPPTTSCATG